MVETIYELPREHALRFPDTTGQGASIRNTFQQKHDKIPHISCAQTSENKQVAANCTNTFKQSEHSTTAVDTSIGHNSEQDQLQLLRRRRADLELVQDEGKAAADRGGDRKRIKLRKTQETKVQAINQSLPNRANQSSLLQASSTAGPDTGIPIAGSRTKRYWPLEVLRHPSLPTVKLDSCKEGVIGRLKEAVDDHSILQDRAQFIDYKAGMVGRAPNQSLASILLFCQERDQKHIKKLLNPGFLTRINCCSPYRPKLLSWASVPSEPTFWIYIFSSITNPTNRFAGSEPVAISSRAGSMPGFCGALAEHRGRVATVGLTVEVDGIAQLLTVDHIFNEPACEDHSSDGDSDGEGSWYYDSGDEDDDALSETHSGLSQQESRLTPASISEETKASPESDTSFEAPTSGTQTHISDAEHQNADQEHDTASRLVEAPIESKTSAHKVQCPNELPREHAYLDWACLELDGKTTERRPESYMLGPDKTRVLLKNIEDSPASHATSVLMISGLGGVRSGRLLAERLHLGSLPGQQMCRVWTLVLDSQTGLVPGECGSVVVAQDTYKVYGHVVGSNILGHAHVVSLREVLDQIKIAFSTDLVYFPCRSSLPPSPQLLSSDEDVLTQVSWSPSQSDDKTWLEAYKPDCQILDPASPKASSSRPSNPQAFLSQQAVLQPQPTRPLASQHVLREHALEAKQSSQSQLAHDAWQGEWDQRLQQLQQRQAQELQLLQQRETQELQQLQQLQQLHLQQIQKLHLQRIQHLHLQQTHQLQPQQPQQLQQARQASQTPQALQMSQMTRMQQFSRAQLAGHSPSLQLRLMASPAEWSAAASEYDAETTTDAYNPGLLASDSTLDSTDSLLISPSEDLDSVGEVGTFGTLFSGPLPWATGDAETRPFKVNSKDGNLTHMQHRPVTRPHSYERHESTAVKRSQSLTEDENSDKKIRLIKRLKGALQSTGQTGFTSGQRQR